MAIPIASTSSSDAGTITVSVASEALPRALVTTPMTFTGNLARAIDDLRMGLFCWRIWWLLGIGDIRQRYSRSRLGQFWITLSTAIFVVAIGTVYAYLFNQPMHDFFPFVATNIIVWTLVSSIMTESCTAFIQAENFLRQEPLPKVVFVLRILVRNMMSFAHNIFIIPFVLLTVGLWPSWTVLLTLPGIILVLVAGFFTSLLLGILCTRFRDLPQIVANVIQIAFFITPVMWPKTLLSGEARAVVDLNPFAAFLDVVAEPMRGIVPSAYAYFVTISTIVTLAAITLPLFARFRARIVYWL